MKSRKSRKSKKSNKPETLDDTPDASNTELHREEISFRPKGVWRELAESIKRAGRPLLLTSIITTCANRKCRKRGAWHNYCPACYCAPPLSVSGRPCKIRYCSPECRRDHWPQHEPRCVRLRQRIYVRRVGILLKELWLATRKVAFDIDIKKLVELEMFKDLFLREGDYACNASGRAFHPFPAKYATAGTEEEQGAVLNLRSCDRALAHCHWLAKELLNDISDNMEEIVYDSRPHNFGFHFVKDDVSERDPNSFRH
ncbi:hypothetical protein EJ08DRAFT_695487 [Tothia fuscella]|uniref:MYND-type domain-containing protein n=1 Tax=Tothia fuscella TaxID=1048955 RepID=A0A9P4NVH0_9PEZI|nr:hypothetical protein EJ08DRAFT_695487 [Tothia fuscella]